jgi:phosphoglycolate phosphatase-like HAD superfamily hydrolase
MRHRNVVAFDLDGTLVDLTAATRAALIATTGAAAQRIDVDVLMAEPRIPLRRRLQPRVAPDALPGC